jgi:hypothetical protein
MRSPMKVLITNHVRAALQRAWHRQLHIPIDQSAIVLASRERSSGPLGEQMTTYFTKRGNFIRLVTRLTDVEPVGAGRWGFGWEGQGLIRPPARGLRCNMMLGWLPQQAGAVHIAWCHNPSRASSRMIEPYGSALSCPRHQR